LVFDRGLPTANLNNAAGGDRSNVAWAFGNPSGSPPSNYFVGDDFSFGTVGQTYQITDLRVWIVGTGTTPLSDIFNTLTLMGGLESPATPTTGSINDISTVDTSGDPNVNIQLATYADGETYQGTYGSSIDMWQVDFTNLNWTVQGGTLYAFFVGATPGTDYFGDGPFLSASNAALSGSPQQGADNLMWYLGQDASTGAINDIGQWDSNGGGWDKSSDVNVELFATPEPSSILFLGTILSIVAFLARREYRKRQAGV
jgi:hypothetical protein